MHGFTGDHNMGSRWLRSKTCAETGGCVAKECQNDSVKLIRLLQSDEQMLFNVTTTKASSVHPTSCLFVKIMQFGLSLT